jgi:hypothetical protein
VSLAPTTGGEGLRGAVEYDSAEYYGVEYYGVEYYGAEYYGAEYYGAEDHSELRTLALSDVAS